MSKSTRTGGLVSIVASLISLGCGPAQAQDKPPIVARAEACLAANVDRVVADEPDVESAANFLVTYVCADEVSGATRYELNLAMLPVWVETMKNMARIPQLGPDGNFLPKPAPVPDLHLSVDPNTGEVVVPKQPPGTDDMLSTVLSQIGPQARQVTPDNTPVALRKLAGALVLVARERQMAKGR